MKINGTYINARGVPSDELTLMQRAVIHYNLAMAWAADLMEMRFKEEF